MQDITDREPTLGKIERDLLELLGGRSVQTLKLKTLDKLLKQHKDQILNAYMLWLHEGLLADTAPQAHFTKPQVRASLLQSWCTRLRNHGFESQAIIQTVCDRAALQLSINAVNRSRLEKIQEELRLALFQPGKEHPKVDQSAIAHNNAPPYIQHSDFQASKTSDNEQSYKAGTNLQTTDIRGMNDPQLKNIASDSDSDIEALSPYHMPHNQHHRLRSTSTPLPFLDPAPGRRGSEVAEKMLSESRQNSSPYYFHEPRSPCVMGASTHGPEPHRETITEQLPGVAPTSKDSHVQFDDKCNGDDTPLVRVKYQTQGFPFFTFTKQRQDAEAQEEAVKHGRRVQHLTIEAPMTNAEQATSKFETSNELYGKKTQDQVPKVGRSHVEYLCHRCGIPGHSRHDCPTNLDPSFDRTPVGSYKCMICGKAKAHLTSVCPGNTNPQSLTQLRLNLGIVITRRLQGGNSTRPIYGNEGTGHQEQRETVFGDTNSGLMNKDRRRAILELSEDDDGQLIKQDSFESRYTQAKRTYSRQNSPQNDLVIDHCTLPTPKRIRTNDRKYERSRERHLSGLWNSNRDREKFSRSTSPGGCRKTSDSYAASTDLLASLDHPQDDRGRLSYWDSGYQTLPAPSQSSPAKYRGPSFSSNPVRIKKQALGTGFWSEGSRVEEIKQLFPLAEPEWVGEVASFEVDAFFKRMDSHMLLPASNAQKPTSDMDTITEQYPKRETHRSCYPKSGEDQSTSSMDKWGAPG